MNGRKLIIIGVVEATNGTVPIKSSFSGLQAFHGSAVSFL